MARVRGRQFTPLAAEADFDRVFAQGRKQRLGPLTLIVLPRSDGFRVGFKIGRKVGNAVVRNRIRRRLKSLFERYRTAPEKGVDLVVVGNPGADQVAWSDLVARMDPHLARAGLVLRGG